MPDVCPTCSEPLRASPLGPICPACMLQTPDLVDDDPAPVRQLLGGRYVLGEQLGEGGFGVVFRAEQREPIQREVAVKILKDSATAKEVINRFDAERQVLALMNHPGIAQVFDAGQSEDGRPFFAMEFVDGKPITKFTERQSAPLRARLELFATVCDAVHHAHQKGVIHRDLKPSNVLVDVDGQPKVIDFGVAKALHGPLTQETLFTGVGQLLGTPGYMCPEQIEHGADAADVRSDVYALGAILFELICDEPAVDPESISSKPLSALLRELSTMEPPAPSSRKPDVDRDLDAVVQMAMALDANRRYPSADALAADVRRFLANEPIVARVPSSWYRARKWLRRNWAIAAAAAGLTLLLSGWAVTNSLLRVEADRNAEALHASLVRSDFQIAQQLSERGQNAEAVAYLARSLRSNPENEVAAAYLYSLLAHEFIPRELTPTLSLPNSARSTRFLEISESPAEAIALCDPNSLTSWNLDTGELVAQQLPGDASVSAWFTIPEIRSVALGFADGEVALWRLETQELDRLTPKLDSAITVLAAAEDGQLLFIGTESGALATRVAPSLEIRETSFRADGPIQKLVATRSGERVAVVSGNQILKFSLAQNRQLPSPEPFEEAVVDFDAFPTGQRMAAMLDSGHVRIFQKRELSSTGGNLPLIGAPVSLSFGKNAQILFSADDRGHIDFWDAKSGKPWRSGIRLDGGIVLCQGLHESGLVGAISERGQITIADANSDRLVSVHTRFKVERAAMSQTGSLAILQNRGVARVWKLRSRLLEPRFLGREVEFARAHSSHDVETAGSIVRLSGVDAEARHAAPVSHALLTPDERTLVTATEDGAHRCWDAATLRPLTPPLQIRAAVVEAEVSNEVWRFRGEAGLTFELPLPPRDLAAPAWFLDYAESIVGVRLTSDGRIIDAPNSDSQPDGSALGTLAKWLEMEAKVRPLWPGDEQPFSDYIQQLLDSGEASAFREARRLDPSL